MLYPVILSGGIGTRLWPASRANLPKQFIKIFDHKSLFQKTMERIVDRDNFQAPIILTNVSQRYLTEAQLLENQVEEATILLEPEQKGTAPAIMLAALDIYARDPSGTILVLSSDNEIKNAATLKKILQTVENAAVNNQRFLLFSSKATYAETGYGYILASKIINKGQKGVKVYEIAHFKEKPSYLEAQACIKSGYQWNSGIFVFPVELFINEMKLHAPEIYKSCVLAYNEAAAVDIGRHKWIFIEKKHFAKSPNDSIDYALIEKTDKAALVKMNIGWHDVGSWKTIYEIANKDQDGNVLKGNVVSMNSRNSYIMCSDNSHIVTAVNLENLTVVQTSDATLILPRSDSQDVKKLTAILATKKHNHFLRDPKTYFSWGYYEIIKHESSTILKKIILYGRKSKTAHGNGMAKHFIVNKGKIRIIWEQQEIVLRKHESLFIKPDTDYKVINLSKFESHIIKMEARVGKHETKTLFVK